MDIENFMEIHVIVEIFLDVWIKVVDQPILPSLEPCHLHR